MKVRIESIGLILVGPTAVVKSYRAAFGPPTNPGTLYAAVTIQPVPISVIVSGRFLLNAAEFPFQSSVYVRFRDVDALGHVNNAVYFTYMEIARGEMFVDLLDIKRPRDFPMILGEARCRYHSAARYSETLLVGVGVARFGNKSFDIVYQIDGSDGRLVAIGRTTMVMYDYEAEKSVPISAEFRQKIEARQGGWGLEIRD